MIMECYGSLLVWLFFRLVELTRDTYSIDS